MLKLPDLVDDHAGLGRLLEPVVSAAANRRDQMYFAIRPDRGEPDVLKNFAIDCDGETVLFQMRCQFRVTLAQHAQQLLYVVRVDFDKRIPTG